MFNQMQSIIFWPLQLKLFSNEGSFNDGTHDCHTSYANH